jgi:ribonuclease-3
MNSLAGAEFVKLLSSLDIGVKDLPDLERAFTHKSYGYIGVDYERLEFLGDSVLSLIVSRFLYDMLPEAAEGFLTKARASVIREESLAEAARRLDFGSLLKLSRGEIATGGRDRDSILADCFEAVLASIYRAFGFNRAEQFVLTALKPELECAVKGDVIIDHKTSLQELLQKKSHVTPSYQIVSEEGPDHNMTFVAEVEHDGIILGFGKGHSKQKAEQLAAKSALENLK